MATRNISLVFASGINKHFGIEYKSKAPTASRIFQMEGSSSKFEDYANWENYGSPVRKNPGAPVVFGEAQQSFTKRFVHDTYALGDLIPKEDWEDDEYGVLHRLLPSKGGGMARVFRQFYDIQHANMFANLGYVAGTSVAGSPDGVSLFNTAHPISASRSATTASNRPSSDADFSIATYQAAATNLRTQKEANAFGIIDNSPACVVTHPSLRYVVKQVLKGEWERGTADRNKNFIRDDNVDAIDWEYFTKSGSTGTNNAWFVLGQQNFLMSFMRSAYDLDTDFDIYTKSHIFTADMRFSFGWVDWRGVYGSVGS